MSGLTYRGAFETQWTKLEEESKVKSDPEAWEYILQHHAEIESDPLPEQHRSALAELNARLIWNGVWKNLVIASLPELRTKDDKSVSLYFGGATDGVEHTYSFRLKIANALVQAWPSETARNILMFFKSGAWEGTPKRSIAKLIQPTLVQPIGPIDNALAMVIGENAAKVNVRPELSDLSFWVRTMACKDDVGESFGEKDQGMVSVQLNPPWPASRLIDQYKKLPGKANEVSGIPGEEWLANQLGRSVTRAYLVEDLAGAGLKSEPFWAVLLHELLHCIHLRDPEVIKWRDRVKAADGQSGSTGLKGVLSHATKYYSSGKSIDAALMELLCVEGPVVGWHGDKLSPKALAKLPTRAWINRVHCELKPGGGKALCRRGDWSAASGLLAMDKSMQIPGFPTGGSVPVGVQT